LRFQAARVNKPVRSQRKTARFLASLALRHVYMTVSVAEFETSPLGLVTWTASAGEVDAAVTATINCEALTNMT
jgi:hypothetical protein